MQFYKRQRRHPPAIIVVALIDILIVLLIFLLVTTTFKQHPALTLALPESSQGQRTGGQEAAPLLVTIDAQGTLLFGPEARPVTPDRLRQELLQAAAAGRDPKLAISADKAAPFGQVVRVMDAAKEAGIKSVQSYTKEIPRPK